MVQMGFSTGIFLLTMEVRFESLLLDFLSYFNLFIVLWEAKNLLILP